MVVYRRQVDNGVMEHIQNEMTARFGLEKPRGESANGDAAAEPDIEFVDDPRDRTISLLNAALAEALERLDQGYSEAA